MRRAAILAIALAAASGIAPTQVLGYEPAYQEGDRYGPYPSEGPRYEDARVVRVDPVLGGGYQASQARCYTREDHYTGGYGRDDYRDYGSYGNDAYGRDGYDDLDPRRDENARMVATVVGGVVGAVLGSKVGGGSGRYATSAIGTMVGGMAGREIYEATRRDRIDRRGRVTVCDPVPDRHGPDRHGGDGYGVDAYDVTYEYGGQRYTTRTDYHPGDTIRVRVDVRPE